MLFHGGCWKSRVGGTQRGLSALADALTQHGMATLNVDYRVTDQPGGGWPGTMRDAGTAIDTLRPLARRYPLDLSRVLVLGHSAGAQLALWSAMRDRLSPRSAVRIVDPLKPAAVMAIDGPGTLAEFVGTDVKVCGEPVIVPYMGGTPTQVPDRYRDASPQDHLPLGVPQYFALGWLADHMQPYIARARRSGDPVAVYRPRKLHHFDIVNPTMEQGKGTVALALQAKARMERRPAP